MVPGLYKATVSTMAKVKGCDKPVHYWHLGLTPKNYIFRYQP